MTRSRFSQPANPSKTPSSRKEAASKNSLGAIAQITILGLSITTLATIFVQNLQPAVQIVFLGQKTLPVPLSVAMFVAFVVGSFLAFVINAIATWQHNLAIRRAVVAAGYGDERIYPENTYPENIKPQNFDNREYEDADNEYEEYEDDDPDTVPYGDRPPLDVKYTK